MHLSAAKGKSTCHPCETPRGQRGLEDQTLISDLEDQTLMTLISDLEDQTLMTLISDLEDQTLISDLEDQTLIS
jgi:hypothetical protein